MSKPKRSEIRAEPIADLLSEQADVLAREDDTEPGSNYFAVARHEQKRRIRYEALADCLYKALDGVLPTEIPGGAGYTEIPNSRLREGNDALQKWDLLEDSP